ncbi:hypothetical protein PC9H_008976 [Pleurotus ostreatus]|uniref:Uncharacterized protein n=1 Tax=Pleurotus ostreatus TaxID=5322 RepID=A0A8H6ZS66_PLEOS|nr:uncharacterized protein PC9H_008976 [Pleurotus ostreatus]KAF7426607.1 hypothetical protein PC9H_008976 [Pleurotus ostreatus]KAJ8694185.1 hypothetical protein PTI98_009113 [Pleurotus ostreatus]
MVDQYDDEHELIDDDEELQPKPQQSVGPNAGNPVVPNAHDDETESDSFNNGDFDDNDVDDGDVAMYNTNTDSDSSTESDPGMPGFVSSQSIIKWVSYDGDSD